MKRFIELHGENHDRLLLDIDIIDVIFEGIVGCEIVIRSNDKSIFVTDSYTQIKQLIEEALE